MVVHTCNTSTLEARQEDHEFEACLGGHIVKTCLKKHMRLHLRYTMTFWIISLSQDPQFSYVYKDYFSKHDMIYRFQGLGPGFLTSHYLAYYRHAFLLNP
jgi:hypothetical protein